MFIDIPATEIFSVNTAKTALSAVQVIYCTNEYFMGLTDGANLSIAKMCTAQKNAPTQTIASPIFISPKPSETLKRKSPESAIAAASHSLRATRLLYKTQLKKGTITM